MVKNAFILIILTTLLYSCNKNPDIKKVVYHDSIYYSDYHKIPGTSRLLPYNATEWYTKKGILKKLQYEDGAGKVLFKKLNKIKGNKILQTKHLDYYRNDTTYEVFYFDNDKQTGYAKANKKKVFVYSEQWIYTNDLLDSVIKHEFHIRSGFDKYTYDSLDRPVDIKSFSSYGGIAKQQQFSYNNNDSIAKVKSFEWGGLISIQNFYYDSLMRLTHQIDSNFKKYIVTEISTSYDENNLPELKNIKQSAGERSVELTHKFFRKFNNNGDWTMRIETINNDTVRVISRDIKYQLF